MEIKKILIANRGEIALRIIRTCKEMGIKTVALCPEKGQENHFLETRLADEYYYLEKPGAEGYLDIKKLLEIAKKAKVDAIHPGYGFLSENWLFAKLCQKNKIIFIGPHHSILKKFEDKMEAKKLAKKLKIPVLPMSEEPVNSFKDLKKWILRIEPPFVLKARRGGGGIGIRSINRDITIGEIFNLAAGIKRQVFQAFKDSEFFLEKYLPSARHIEFQILGDGKSFIHLFERNCSIQRRFQKILEEAPSPDFSLALREKMAQASLALAKEVKYQTVGTVEFLVDENENFYFLEVNPRIQVEHPVTEAITGVDLVEWQIRISQGEKLKLNQEQIKPEAWAIETRICAEDPSQNFRPSPGRIEKLVLPGGQGIFVHTFLHEGQEVFPYFDSLLMKLISFGKDREEAVLRLKRALEEVIIEGIPTNISLFKKILEEEEFLEGKYTCQFLEKNKILEKLQREKICFPPIQEKTILPEEEIANLIWHIWRQLKDKGEVGAPKVSRWKHFYLFEE
jgi:acetyl-CoA carboxylase biotin carboxylase subunit